MVLLLSFVLSLASVLYELTLAQTLSATMSNTFFRYVTTISLFLGGLGIGAALFRRDKDPLRQLVTTEVLLVFIGAAAPLWVLCADFVFAQAAFRIAEGQAAQILSESLLTVFNYLLVLGIAVLTGFELPALLAISEVRGTPSKGSVLALDYLGMFAGAVLFPFLLLPRLGVFGSAGIAGALNIFALVMITGLLPERRLRVFSWGAGALAALMLLVIGTQEEVFIEMIYLGGHNR